MERGRAERMRRVREGGRLESLSLSLSLTHTLTYTFAAAVLLSVVECKHCREE